MNTPLRHSGMACILKGSQFYLNTPHSSANGMNHTCLCLPSRSWYSFTGYIQEQPPAANPNTILTLTLTLTRGLILDNAHLPTRRDGRLSWPWVAGWLRIKINVRHWELNLDTVAISLPMGPGLVKQGQHYAR